MFSNFFGRSILTAAILGVFSVSLPAFAADGKAPAVPTDQDVTAPAPGTDDIGPIPDDPAQIKAWAAKFMASLTKRTGNIELGDNLATIKTGDDYYYLSPIDARKVLEKAWGNPPGSGGLGMLFPAKYSPLDPESWGVVISYEEMGHVKDDDADKINYDDLLAELKKDTAAESKERVKAGYAPMELVGWAEKPYYDAKAKKLYWAKDYKVGDNSVHSLNYNVRILGRKGVLVMNFVASMNELPEIRSQIGAVLTTTNFEPGNLFGDFNPSLDKVAAVGIGGLIAGKVLAKAGLLAFLLLGLKKIGLVLLAFKKIVLVGIAAGIGFIKRLFGKGDDAVGKGGPLTEMAAEASSPAADTPAGDDPALPAADEAEKV